MGHTNRPTGLPQWMLISLIATLIVACSSDSTTLTLNEWVTEVCNAREALASVPAPPASAILLHSKLWREDSTRLSPTLTGLSPPDSASNYHSDLIEFYRAISSAQHDFIEAVTDGGTAASDTAAAQYQDDLEQAIGDVDLELPTELQDAVRDAGCES